MAGIWEYPELQELENFMSELTLRAANNVAEETVPEAVFVDELALRKVLVVDEWGEGTAQFGQDDIHLVLFFSFGGPDAEFDDVADIVTSEMTEMIQSGNILPPQELISATDGFKFTPLNIEAFNDILLQMSTGGLELVYNLTDAEAIDLKEGEAPDTYPRIPLEELQETPEEEVEDEADVDDATPNIDISDVSPLPESQIPEVETEVDVGPDLSDVNENLRPFAISEDKLEIPAGKERKGVEVREPYDFEKEMATPGITTDTRTSQRTMESIARPVGSGTLGTSEAVGTYPRTGVYIRNHLKFKGPSYAYEMYKDLVVYSAYISTLHNINVRAGQYSTFREYIYVLKEIPERGGPELIDGLSQQQAAAQELETIPDHPSIEDAKAPWLESRQFYKLVEENDEHDAWRNAYDFLQTLE